MSTPSLSYIIVTKDKFPYLKNRLEKLLAEKKDDEEILIGNGGTDETGAYIARLKEEGKIKYALSEPDLGESHAMNKLFLMLHGTLIKLITDDDVFYYPAIEACKKFMLEHPEIDMLGSEGGCFKHKTARELALQAVAGYEQNYRQWQKDRTPFEFSGLGSMWRTASIPILGFWNLSFRAADAEFTFRATAGRANIAWYTGYSFVYIKNQQSVSWVYREKIRDETRRLRKFYLDEDPPSGIMQKLKKLMRYLTRLPSRSPVHTPPTRPFAEEWPDPVARSEERLQGENAARKPEFLWNRK